jgi:DNA-directed RNA polymerase specialized sigma24 family protein
VGARWPAGGRSRAASDPAEQVALVARAKRELLLRVHGYRLRREDLEDCYSQATLELVVQARRGRSFADGRHLANALEQRFVSRIYDCRRALSGRSPMQAAVETAVSLDWVEAQRIEIVDVRAEPETLVILRQDLRRAQVLAQMLSPDQRLVLASQVGLQMSCREFCRRHGWSPEKYRKVAQRARARLKGLMLAEAAGVPHEHDGRSHRQEPACEPLSPHS